MKNRISTMKIDVDPLLLSDPLDCGLNVEEKIEGENKCLFQSKPEIVADILVGGEIVAGSDLRFVEKSKNSKCSESKKSTAKIGKGKTETIRENYLKKYKSTKDKWKIYANETCQKTFVRGSRLKCDISCHRQRFFPCPKCGKSLDGSINSNGHFCGTGHDSDVHNGQMDEIEAGREKNEEENEKKEEENRLFRESEEKSAGDKSRNCKRYYDRLKSERKYRCEICHKTFITVGHLNTHMHCHSGKKWKCDGCGKHFSCERSLCRHKDTFPGAHRFPCLFCDVIFFRSSNLAKHVEIKHPETSTDPGRFGDAVSEFLENDAGAGCKGEGKSTFCAERPGTIGNGENLKIGIFPKEKSTGRTEGNDVANYECDVCSKKFVSQEGFEYHKNNQHVDRQQSGFSSRKMDGEPEIADDGIGRDRPSPSNFPCKICTESFPARSSLLAHLKAHNVAKNVRVKPGSHRCCICPRSFSSSDGLKYHLATHTGERRHSCGECGKKFIKKTHLFEHVATHSKVKHFKCVRCPRTFSTYSAYRKHAKHYPGPHSFPCTKCGKLFAKESMIEKHTCVDLTNVTMAPEVKALLEEEKTTGEEDGLLSLKRQRSADGKSTGNERVETNGEKISLDSVESDSESPHSCYKCFKVFPSLSMLQSHQYEHVGKQQYQCRFCPENFNRADDFGAHIRDHLGSSPYMCLKCNRKFISPLTLSMHAKKYPGEHSFACRKCQRWFPSEKRLEKHECILQNADAFACACGSLLKNWNEFVSHAGSKPYKCCSCHLEYLTLVALARHIKRHTGSKPFACESCGKSFRSKTNYLNHRSVHEGANEIGCEHCEFKSKSRKRMDFHLFRKHKIGSNTCSTLCPICGIIFPYATHVKKHVETEHGNDSILEGTKGDKKSSTMVLCTLCGKLLSNKYMLANHTKKVHDPNAAANGGKFACNVCEEKFNSKKLLEKHSTVHDGPGSRICEICSREFYFAKDLRKHMRRHDTSKPYSCLKCGKNFKVSVSLKYHSSICGNAKNAKTSAICGKRKKEEKLSGENIYYGGVVEPFELKNRSCSAFYRKWNT